MSKSLDALEEHAERERLRAEIREERARQDAERQAEHDAEDVAIASEQARTAQLERDAVEATYPWGRGPNAISAWNDEHPDAGWSVEQVLEQVSEKRGTISLEHLERLSESELARFKAEHKDLYRRCLADEGPRGIVQKRDGNRGAAW